MIGEAIILYGLVALYMIFLVARFNRMNRIVRLYNNALQSLVYKYQKQMASDELKWGWRTLSGTFGGRVVSTRPIIEHHINSPHQIRLSMAVDMPASFSFTIKPYKNWQTIYNRIENPTYHELFHLKSFPEGRIEQILQKDALLGDKLIESVALFLGKNKAHIFTISGKAGQLTIDHQLGMAYEAGLEAMLNGMAHLAEAIEMMDDNVAITF